jgi:hypothetical protein
MGFRVEEKDEFNQRSIYDAWGNYIGWLDDNDILRILAVPKNPKEFDIYDRILIEVLQSGLKKYDLSLEEFNDDGMVIVTKTEKLKTPDIHRLYRIHEQLYSRKNWNKLKEIVKEKHEELMKHLKKIVEDDMNLLLDI